MRKVHLVSAFIKDADNVVVRLPAKYNSAMISINKVLESNWNATVTFIFSNKLRFDIVYALDTTDRFFRERIFSFYHDVIPNIKNGSRVFLIRNDGSCVALPMQLESAVVVLQNNLVNALEAESFTFDRLEAYTSTTKLTHVVDVLVQGFIIDAEAWLRNVMDLQSLKCLDATPKQNPFEF